MTTSSPTARYSNPVQYEDGVTRTNPDPFILRFGSGYWCYSSDEKGVNCSYSPDLVSWEAKEKALVVPGCEQYWAPCVVYASGKFWMYVSFRPSGNEDPHTERLHVAVSDRPEGPFEPVRRFFDIFSIDADVVRDPLTGRWVMFYCTNEPTGLDTEFQGTSILVDEMVSMTELVGRPRAAVVPSLDEEIFMRNRFEEGRDWYTIEGAAWFKHRDRCYMTYSGNAYVGVDYFIGFATADSELPITQQTWKKYPDNYTWSPLVRASETVEGTGHNSITTAPNLVDLWIVYHGRDASIPIDEALEQRVMRIDELSASGSRLITHAPTSTPQSAPAQPSFQDSFTAEALGNHWEPSAANVVHRSDDLFSDYVSTKSQGVCDVVSSAVRGPFVMEVYLRAVAGDSGARFGVSPVYVDSANRVDVLLDAASRRIQVIEVINNVRRVVASAGISGDVSSWQRLQVVKSLGRVQVSIDGYDAIDAAVDGLYRAGIADEPLGARWALTSVGTPADFAAVTLQEHLRLEGRELERSIARIYRASRTTTATKQGVGSFDSHPLTLSSLAAFGRGRRVFDVELLSKSSKVVLTTLGSPRITLTLTEDSTNLEWDGEQQTGGREERAVDTLRLPLPGHRNLTVDSRGATTRIAVDDVEFELQLTLPPNHLHELTLVKSLLRGFEVTPA